MIKPFASRAIVPRQFVITNGGGWFKKEKAGKDAARRGPRINRETRTSGRSAIRIPAISLFIV